MKVFISLSGNKSHKVGLIFRERLSFEVGVLSKTMDKF